MKSLILIVTVLSSLPAFALTKTDMQASFREKQKLVRIVKQDDAVAGALRSAPEKYCKIKDVNAVRTNDSKPKSFEFDLTILCHETGSSQTALNVKGSVIGKKVQNLTLTRDFAG